MLTTIKPRLAVVLGLLMLCVTGLAMATTASAQTGIEGRVYRTSDNRYVSNANVFLDWKVNGSWQRYGPSTRSDARGHYQFIGLPSGRTWRVRASTYFANCWWDIADYYKGESPPRTNNPGWGMYANVPISWYARRVLIC